MKEKVRNFLSLFLRFGLSFLLLTYLFSKMDFDKTIEVLKSADVRYIYLAVTIFLGINFLLLIRWSLLIRALSLNVSFRDIVCYFFIGLFFNLFLPSSTGGDLIKTIGLCRVTSERAKVVASVVLDRLSGFMAICFLAFIAYIFGYKLVQDNTLLISIFILASFSWGLLIFLFNEKLYSTACRVFNKFPNIKKKLMQLHYDIVLLNKNRRILLSAVGISLLSQVILAFVFFLVAKGLHQDIRMGYFLIFVPLICVISSLPSIGGLGVRDAGAVYLFAKIGVATGVAVSISMINFLFMVIVGLMGGVVYVVALSPRRVQHYQSDTEVSPKKA